jgi:hypothetical protein
VRGPLARPEMRLPFSAVVLFLAGRASLRLVARARRVPTAAITGLCWWLSASDWQHSSGHTRRLTPGLSGTPTLWRSRLTMLPGPTPLTYIRTPDIIQELTVWGIASFLVVPASLLIVVEPRYYFPLIPVCLCAFAMFLQLLIKRSPGMPSRDFC